MKIDKAILVSTNDSQYLDYWETVKKAWLKLNIEPILYVISKESTGISNEKLFFIDNLNPVFVAQNLRLLIPALYPNDVCILSDIDMMPLSKRYFQDSISDISQDKIIIYRSDATPEEMLPICWNAALGSTWGEVFSINNEKDIKSLLETWYPKKYKPYKKNWYIDQIKLREYVSNFELNYKNRVKYFTDDELSFKRLNRDTLKEDLDDFIKNPKIFFDFHMPRNYQENKSLIKNVFELNFESHE